MESSKTNRFVFLSIIGIFCFNSVFNSICAQSNQNNQNSLLWEISGKTLARPVYLFGTFHLMCADELPFSDTVYAIIQQSDALILEMDLDDPAVSKEAMMGMQMKDGKKLRDLYTKEEYKRLADYFIDSLKIKIEFWERNAPVMLESMVMMKWFSCKQVTSPEKTLMDLIKKNGKPVYGLETMAEQKAVMDKITPENQAKSLLSMIDSMEIFKDELFRFKSMYLTQQLDLLVEPLDDRTSPEFEKIILGNRNALWIKRLPALWNQGGVMIAVGAGHLPGKHGLIKLLRKSGYQVKPVPNPLTFQKQF
jgi:uncharacterized protein YbaP (TraB family)